MRSHAPSFYPKPAPVDTIRPPARMLFEPYFELAGRNGERLLLRWRFDDAWHLVVDFEQMDVLNPGEEPAITAHRPLAPRWTADSPTVEPGARYDVRAAFDGSEVALLVDGRRVWSNRT